MCLAKWVHSADTTFVLAIFWSAAVILVFSRTFVEKNQNAASQKQIIC